MINKILLLALLIILGQSAYTEPSSEISLSPELKNAKLIRTIESFSVPNCTQSSAEAHALAYPTSAKPETNVANQGRHYAIITNCTGETARFIVTLTLISEEGAKDTVVDFYDIPHGGAEMITTYTFISLYYPNVGEYTLTATTVIKGPNGAGVDDSAENTAIVSISN